MLKNRKKENPRKKPWFVKVLKVIGALILIVLLIFGSFTAYVILNKKKLFGLITTALNKNLDGNLSVGSMEPSFRNFPSFSVSLQKVLLKDKRWNIHHHTLLDAQELSVSINPLPLLKGIVQINRIWIRQAQIDLFTDSTGYTNTSVFRKKKTSGAPSKNTESSIEINNLDLSQVSFHLENEKRFKHFQFEDTRLEGKINYGDSGWKAHASLSTQSKYLAFNTRKGSFIQNQPVSGTIDLEYNQVSNVFRFSPNTLHIGKESFIIGARFDNRDTTLKYRFDISNDRILWKDASSLLAKNISLQLDKFNLTEPLAVQTILEGDFQGGNDPFVYVTCQVSDNSLTTPEGNLNHVSFNGLFTNENQKGRERDDKNSVIKLFKLNARYEDVPFVADTVFISNLDKPILSGIIRSQFGIDKLNPIIGAQNMILSKGSADLRLIYKADIINYQIIKPLITGTVHIKDADILYVPRNLLFKRTSISLTFTKTDLLLKDIRIQNGKSIVYMNGRINNFLNFYYQSPEKILLSWNIHSPQVYLGEFLGFLNARKRPVKTRKHGIGFADQLSDALEKGKADMHLDFDQVHYKKFLATEAHADLLLSEDGIEIKNMEVKNSGGSLKVNGKLIQNETSNHFSIHALVNNVNVSTFFYSFNSFGMQDLTDKNIKGFLSTQADISGDIKDTGDLLPKSMSGTVTVDLSKAALIDYHPILSFGKFIFPFRNLKNVSIDRLKGRFDLNGDLIKISPMQINSSILNINIGGTYSFGRGTNILVDVPLRNPKKDELKDDSLKQASRMKGIVLHVQARDDENGKIKFHLVKNPEKRDKAEKSGKTD